ncbi:MAG: Spy/CpxP family protein refolding chaperone [Bryobacteraceae bacterium]
MRKIMRSAAFVLLAAGCLFAQPPLGRGRDDQSWVERKTQFLANRLTLSDSQKQQVLSLFTASDQNTESLETKLLQARRALRDATRRNAPDNEIDQLAGTVGFLFGQVEAVKAKADTAVYNLLTAEQRQKMDRGYGGGRGMMGGPGGPRFPERH